MQAFGIGRGEYNDCHFKLREEEPNNCKTYGANSADQDAKQNKYSDIRIELEVYLQLTIPNL